MQTTTPHQYLDDLRPTSHNEPEEANRDPGRSRPMVPILRGLFERICETANRERRPRWGFNNNGSLERQRNNDLLCRAEWLQSHWIRPEPSYGGRGEG